MATPIQYIQQPVFSNIGVLERGLTQDQARHDQAMAQQVAMEDMFAQVPTHPSDIGVKNKVLGEFQDKVKQTVDRYGGDYGAAAKDLTRLTSRTRQNPFFILAPERRRLAEEQRKRMAALGPNAYLNKDVTAVPLQDPETGEWISPEELQTEVLDRRQYLQQLESDYSGLKSRTTPLGMRRNAAFPQFIEEDIQRGIGANEVGAYAERMYEDLMRKNPNLPEELARELSVNYANQLNLGIKTERRSDPNWGKRSGGNDDPWQFPKFQTYASDVSQSAELGEIMEEASEVISGKEKIVNLQKDANIISDFLLERGIPLTGSDVAEGEEFVPEETPEHIQEAIDRVNTGKYSMEDLGFKWTHQLNNKFKQIDNALDNFFEGINPGARLERRSDAINAMQETLQEGSPEEKSQLYSLIADENDNIVFNENTGLYTYKMKGLDVFEDKYNLQKSAQIAEELVTGIRKKRKKIKKLQKEYNNYLEENPLALRTLEMLQEQNPEADELELVNTALTAAAAHKQKQAATHYIEMDIYDDLIGKNMTRRIKSADGEVLVHKGEDGEYEEEADVNLKKVLSKKGVDIIDVRYIPGESSFKITTNEEGDNNYKIKSDDSNILSVEAVNLQKNVNKFLEDIRNLNIDTPEDGGPIITVDGIPYSAIQRFDPKTLQYHTAIIDISDRKKPRLITEGEFLNRYAYSVTERLGHARKRKEEKVN